MKLSFGLPIGGAWATPANQRRIAREAEQAGYAGLWTFQRLFHPIRPQNDYPPMRGQPWPATFERTMDPVISLAHVASVTETIRLGTAVLLMPYYSPILMAKELATLDQVAGGRLDVGLGLGWSKDEYQAVGVSFRDRGRRADEFLRCLKAIWCDDICEFHGEFYELPPARIEVRPIQQPHPPLLIGGYGPAVIDRVARFGDGFIGGNVPLDEVAPLAARLRAISQSAGRSKASLRLVSRGTLRVYPASQGSARRPLWGSIEEIREDIRRYADAGLTELFLDPNFDPDIALASDAETAISTALSILGAFAPGGQEIPGSSDE